MGEQKPTGWQPIETAPRDGTMIDLWADGARFPDCLWGKPDHCCGEAGQYCDSEWHGQPEGWVVTAINDYLWSDFEPTHWRPLPAPPQNPRTCATCARATPMHDRLGDGAPLPLYRLCGLQLPPWASRAGDRAVLADSTCDLWAEPRHG